MPVEQMLFFLRNENAQYMEQLNHLVESASPLNYFTPGATRERGEELVRRIFENDSMIAQTLAFLDRYKRMGYREADDYASA